MKWKNRIGRSLSIILALAFAVVLCIPAMAWAADTPSTVGPLRVFYTLDEGDEQELGSKLDESAYYLEEKGLDPSAFEALHLRIAPSEGYSFSEGGKQITSVDVSWQTTTAAGTTVTYGIDLAEADDGSRVCDIPAALLKNVKEAEYDYFKISWTTNQSFPDQSFGHYKGIGLFAGGDEFEYDTASLVGTYKTDNGPDVIIGTSPEGKQTVAISDQTTTNQPTLAGYAYNQIEVTCDSSGQPRETSISATPGGASMNFVVGTDDHGNKTLTAKDKYKYSVAEGFDKGLISKKQVFTQTMVASAGGESYRTLQQAIDNAQDGGTVTVLEDIQENVVVADGKNIVLDLNGKTVAGQIGNDSKNHNHTIIVEGSLTVKDSTAAQPPVVSDDYKQVSYDAGKVLCLPNTTYPYAKAILVQNGGSATIESGIVEAEDSDAAFVKKGSSLTVTGGYIHSAEYGIGVEGEGASLKMEGGVVVADNNAAIGGNGTDDVVYRDTSIEVSGGTVISHIATDGYIACGIYHPQRGTLQITGGTVYADGGVGVLMRGGALDMTGGEVIATGDASGKVGDAKEIQGCYGIQIDGASSYYDSANSKVNISGGAVKAGEGIPALNQVDVEGKLFVTGGEFSSDPSAYVVDGFVARLNGTSSMYEVTEREVIEVFDSAGVSKGAYGTFERAIANAESGDTLALLSDIDTTLRQVVRKDITFDLGGNTYTGSHANGPFAVVGCTLTVKNGTIKTTDGDSIAVYVQDAAVVLDEGATIEAAGYGLQVGNLYGTTGYRGDAVVNEGATIKAANGSAVYVVGYYQKGTAANGSLSDDQDARNTLTINGGIIESVEGNEYAAVSGNGNKHGTEIVVNSGSIIANSKGVAIYHPQLGNLVVKDGTISGGTGIEMRAGTLDVSGDAVIEGLSKPVDVNPNGSGNTTAGAGIAIAQHTTKLPIDVNISGGAVSGFSALYESNPQGNSADDLAKVTLSVTGGTFNAINDGTLAVYSENKTGFVTGGTFSSDPSAYVADGFAARLNDANMYEVTEDAVIEVSGSDGVVRGAYSTFARAIAHAESGDTLKLLVDASIAENTIIDKSLTINLNGRTVTNNVAGARAFDVVGNGVELTVDGTIAGSSMIVPEANETSYGLFKVVEDATGCKVTFNGGTYAGNGLKQGVLLVYSPSIGATSVVLNNVTATSSRFLAYADVEGELNVSITGGSLKATNCSALAFGSPIGKGTVKFEGATVDANNGYGTQVSGPTATFKDCTFTATDAGDPQAPTTAVAVSGNGTVNIESGSYTSNHYGVYVYSSGGTMNVLGGEVSGDVAAVKADANATSYPDPVSVVNISGGTIKGALEPDANSRIHVTGGTFDRLVEEYYDGNIYKQNALNAAVEPGKVVPCSWTIEYNLAGGTLSSEASNPTSYTYLDDDITLVNPERPGYDFAGWTGTGIEGASDTVVIAKGSGDRSYTATWVARTDTPYTVEHWFQNVEGEEYALDEGKTQELRGTTDADTAAVALSETGFTANTFEQQKIAGDGSTVVEIYYDRNVHEVTYAYEGAVPEGASALPDLQQLRYGAPVVAAPAAAAPGYTFSGWGVSAGYTMPDEDIVLTGSFTANGDTPYKVKHYLEALDGSYELASTDELKGETDATATAAPKTFTGFTYNPEAAEAVESGAIAGNGSLVLKLYYDRNSYEVSYAYVGTVPAGAPDVPDKAAVKFGATVTPAAAPTLTGYDFSGWSKAAPFEMPAGNVEVTGSWKARSDVSYTVHYYLDGTTTKLADDKVAEGCTFGSTHAEHAVAIAGYTPKGERAQSVVLDAYGKELSFFYTADEARITFETNGGSKADDLVGKTGEPTTGSLPSVTRPGYAFAGWFADKALTQPVEALPATFAAGSITYYAKWNALPLPDADVEIQVEVPQPAEDGSTYAAVPEEAVKAAAEHAQSALEAIGAGEVPAGVSAQDAQAVADVLKSAEADDKVSVIVTLKFEEKAQVDEEEHLAIADAASGDEGVALFLELGVEMTVKVEGDSGTKAQETISLGEVTEPLLFEIHVDPALIQGKSVRIAHVHEGVTEIIYPESVDREQGIVRFYASKFSTYALLTSETVTVTFEPNGGTAVEAQTLKFGERASKPVDPTRDGFSFAGWFSDEGLTQAYDFSAPVERAMTLYAKWTEAGGSGSGGAAGDDDATGDVAKPLPQTAKKLVPTGDGTGALASSAALLVVLAGAVAVAASIRRRNRD